MEDTINLNPEVLDKVHEQPPETESNGFDEDMETGSDENVETSVTSCSRKADNESIPALPAGFESFEGSVVPVISNGGCLSVQGEFNLSNHEEDENSLRKREMDVLPLSGVKRPRLTVDEKQPSVHVNYNSLPRESGKKLRGLLQQWSQWHSQNYPSSDDSNVLLESGEETYFPALHVGLDKPCAVTFWMDDKVKTDLIKDFVPLDCTSVPLYDRGYSSALASADVSANSDRGVQKLDAFRCFNCGSYSHALKDCPRPRDNTAVNNARKEHKSKRNQNSNSRNVTRYYQSSNRGKYDGLKPGTLGADTKKALGIGEFDPPPWLNRMREIGYPPGYLDHDEEDQPSGITIFGDVISNVEAEEGEISDVITSQPLKKTRVEFPGINAPIPDDADQWLWAPSSAFGKRARHDSTENQSRTRHPEPLWHRPIDDHHSKENHSRRSYLEPRWNREMNYESSNDSRYRRNYFESDLPPPGCEPGMSPSLSTRYSRYDDRHSSYYDGESTRTESGGGGFSRSWSERGWRRSPVRYDDSWPHTQW